jgi:hypothetical protein
VEVGRIAGQNDNAAGRIRLHFIVVELIADADVDAGHDCVYPVLRMSMWHQLDAGGHFDPDYIGAGLSGLTDNDGKGTGRWECRERLPVDVSGRD